MEISAAEAFRHSSETKEALARHEDGCALRYQDLNRRIDKLEERAIANSQGLQRIEAHLQAERRARQARQGALDRRAVAVARWITAGIAAAGLAVAMATWLAPGGLG